MKPKDVGVGRVGNKAPVRKRAFTARDFDTCVCGDYRHQHLNDGTGACVMANDMSHGYQPCKKFRCLGIARAIPEYAKSMLYEVKNAMS